MIFIGNARSFIVLLPTDLAQRVEQNTQSHYLILVTSVSLDQSIVGGLKNGDR